MRSLGAARVIDYAKQDFTQSGEIYDIILDAVGNCTFARCERALSSGGRLLLVVSSLGQTFGAMLHPSRADGRCSPECGAHARRRPALAGKSRRVRRLQACGRSKLPIRAHRRCSRTCRHGTQEGQRRDHAAVKVALAPGVCGYESHCRPRRRSAQCNHAHTQTSAMPA